MHVRLRLPVRLLLHSNVVWVAGGYLLLLLLLLLIKTGQMLELLGLLELLLLLLLLLYYLLLNPGIHPIKSNIRVWRLLFSHHGVSGGY
jgi:hypothetical protein